MINTQRHPHTQSTAGIDFASTVQFYASNHLRRQMELMGVSTRSQVQHIVQEDLIIYPSFNLSE